MRKKKLVIATRKSPLALAQATFISQALSKLYPALTIELLGMTTQGDIYLTGPLRQEGGKGLFVKELEQALLDQRADIAVHSMKDVPPKLPPKLHIPVMTQREDPYDAFCASHYASLAELPHGAKIGTASLRRQVQLLHHRPDLRILSLRGNVQTRLQRLDNHEFDAIILAVAGLKRLHLNARITEIFSSRLMLPAAGQGALGLQCRKEDDETLALITPLNNGYTYNAVMAERVVTAQLEGGCQAPVAAYAEYQENHLTLRALVGKQDGSLLLTSEQTAPHQNYLSLGMKTAQDLLAQGAKKIISAYQS